MHGYQFGFVISFRAIVAVKFISHTFANFQINYTISVRTFFLHVFHIENDGTNQLAFGNV